MTGMTAWQASGGGGAGEQWMQVVGVAYIAKQSVRTSPAQMGPLKLKVGVKFRVLTVAACARHRPRWGH